MSAIIWFCIACLSLGGLIVLLVPKLICLVRHHKYEHAEELWEGVRRIRCARCQREWCMVDISKTLVPWTKEFDELPKRSDLCPPS